MAISSGLKAKYEVKIADLESKMTTGYTPEEEASRIDLLTERVRRATQKKPGLSEKEWAVLLRMRQKVLEPVYSSTQVSIPAWDDIIVIQERDESSLLDLGVQEWLRREMQFVVDPSSPTPEVVQHLGTIMTIIDDMQDFAAFFGWGGYELFKRARRMAPGPWGPFFNGRDAIERAFQSRCLVKGGKNQKPNLEKEMRDYSYRQIAFLYEATPGPPGQHPRMGRHYCHPGTRRVKLARPGGPGVAS